MKAFAPLQMLSIHVVRIVCTLGKYDQRRLRKLICIVNPFDLLFKTIHKKNLSFHWRIRI